MSQEDSSEITEILAGLSNLKKTLTGLQNSIKQNHKHMTKKIKVLEKQVEKTKYKGNRKPSGFAKPGKVTDELCLFMGKDKGTEIARTEVTQYLIQYIKNNNLQYKENNKIIIPDKELKDLLDIKGNEELTYFNIQGLMNKHFIKSTNSNNFNNHVDLV